jgi:hypothetical protein
MPHRRLAHVDITLSGHIASIETARALLFDVDVDRKKRIDDAIDYFGASRARVGRDPCGESWLDKAGSR